MSAGLSVAMGDRQGHAPAQHLPAHSIQPAEVAYTLLIADPYSVPPGGVQKFNPNSYIGKYNGLF